MANLIGYIYACSKKQYAGHTLILTQRCWDFYHQMECDGNHEKKDASFIIPRRDMFCASHFACRPSRGSVRLVERNNRRHAHIP
jgi:hypothetical protein